MAVTVTAVDLYHGDDGSLVTTSFEVYHYVGATGRVTPYQPYTGTGPGGHGGIIYDPDDPKLMWEWYNARYTIKTDAFGATGLTLTGLTLGVRRQNRLLMAVTTDPDEHRTNGTNGVQLHSDGTGLPTLLPNTTYYFWIFCPGGNDDQFDIGDLTITATDDYEADWNLTASDAYFGDAVPISIPAEHRPSTRLAKYVYYAVCCDVRVELGQSSLPTSGTWTPDVEDFAAGFPNANNAAATIYCEFSSGRTVTSPQTHQTYTVWTLEWVASKTITLTLKEDQLLPQLTTGWATHSYYNTGTEAANIAAYVQGFSKAQVTFDDSKVACQYGATIAGYKISCEGVTASASPYLTGILSGLTASIACTVTDSRGQKASATLEVTLNAYSPPRMANVDIKHYDYDSQNDRYDPSDDGSYIGAIATAIISTISGLNAYTMTIYTKNPGGSYSSQGTMTSDVLKLISLFSPDQTWDVKIVLVDSLGFGVYYETRLASRFWAMKFRPDGRGVGFGKAPEHSDAMELPHGWKIYFGENCVYPDMIGNAENADTAASAHSAGEFFLWKDQLVKATAAISAGGTIAATGNSANVSVTSIADVLGALVSAAAASTAAIGRISVGTVELDDQTVNSSSYSMFTLDVSRAGYTPIGVVGWRIGNATTNGARCSYISVYAVSLSGASASVNVRNHNTSNSAKIKISLDVLYI